MVKWCSGIEILATEQTVTYYDTKCRFDYLRLQMKQKVMMNSIIVDQDRCIRCGICIQVCPQFQGWNTRSVMPSTQCDIRKQIEPTGVTNTTGDTPVSQVLEKIAPNCIKCGHCEVFCPAGALKLTLAPDEMDSEKIGAEDILPDHLGIYLKSRRSIRNFSLQKVEKEKIEQMLDIARYAASGCNSQPVQWLVVHDENVVRRLAGLTVDWMSYLCENKDPMSAVLHSLKAAWDHGIDPVCWNAPHILIAHIPEKHPSAPIDSIIALTHFDIVAPAFGIGTCWAGLLTYAAQSWKPLQEMLALPQGHVISYAMVFGYPQYKTYRIPRRNPSKIVWM